MACCRWTLWFNQTGIIDGNVIIILFSPNKTREECDRFRTRHEPMETIQEEGGRNGIIGEVKEKEEPASGESVSYHSHCSYVVYWGIASGRSEDTKNTQGILRQIFPCWLVEHNFVWMTFTWIDCFIHIGIVTKRKCVGGKKERDRNRKFSHFQLHASGQKTKEDDVESGQASPFDKFVSNNRKAIGTFPSRYAIIKKYRNFRSDDIRANVLLASRVWKWILAVIRYSIRNVSCDDVRSCCWRWDCNCLPRIYSISSFLRFIYLQFSSQEWQPRAEEPSHSLFSLSLSKYPQRQPEISHLWFRLSVRP